MPGPHEDGGMMYSNSELNDPEYSTDDFRMFSFKVARCSKRYVHDWRSCPFAHPTENARRRDPRTVRYLPVPCPDYKRGICMRGDTCPYSHGVYECWLHPAKYRTQLCKEGPQCRRPVCFFAHTVGDLRQPTHLWNGSNGEGVQAPCSAAANLINMQEQPAINTDVIKSSPSMNNNNNNLELQAQRSDSDAANIMQVAAEEAFNNMQEQSVPMHSGFPGQSSDSPPLSPLATAAAAGFNVVSSALQKSGEDATPRTPSHQGGDPFASNAIDCVANGGTNSISAGTGSGQEDSSVAASDITSQQSSEDITITANAPTVAAASAAVAAAAATAAASRISLDSNMQLRAANQAARTGAPSWSQGLAASASAAVALAGVPVNEQPMLPNHGPRMSNAVARKLGLAPVKPPTATVAAVTPVSEPVRVRSNGNAAPARHSIDGALPVQQPQYQQQQPQRASFDEVHLSQAALASFGNGNNGMTFPSANINAQFANGNSVNGGAAMNGNNVALHQFHQQQQQQQLFAYANGDPHNNGFVNGHMTGINGAGMVVEDPGVASLLGHMSQWGLSESSGDSIRGEGSVHSSKNSMSYPHRGSSDGMLGATGLPQQGPPSSGVHTNGGQGSAASYLMSLDLGGAESNNNNNRGVSSEC